MGRAQGKGLIRAEPRPLEGLIRRSALQPHCEPDIERGLEVRRDGLGFSDLSELPPYSEEDRRSLSVSRFIASILKNTS